MKNANNGYLKPSVDALWLESRITLDRLTSAAASYIASCPGTPQGSDNVPIFLIHAMYEVARAYLRITQGTPDGESKEKLESIRLLLQMMNSRWRLAGKS